MTKETTFCPSELPFGWSLIEQIPSPPLPQQRETIRRWLIEGLEPSIHDPNYWSVQELLSEEMDLQRRQVQKIGQCHIGCTADHLFEGHAGVICRLTLMPCPNDQLSSIVKLVSIVNQRSHPNV